MSREISGDTITHEYPLRRGMSNFIIFADIGKDDPDEDWKWEQLWARERGENLFELCCVPFFAYGLAMEDIVETSPLKGKHFVIRKVIKSSGNYTYRVFFSQKGNWTKIISDIESLGCAVEIRWNKSKVIGINVPFEKRQLLEGFLSPLVASGEIECELANH